MLCDSQIDPRLPEHGALRRLPRQHVLQQVPPVEVAGEVKHSLSQAEFLFFCFPSAAASYQPNLFTHRFKNSLRHSGIFGGTELHHRTSMNMLGGGEEGWEQSLQNKITIAHFKIEVWNCSMVMFHCYVNIISGIDTWKGFCLYLTMILQS